MAETTHKTLPDGVKRWNINFWNFWNLVKYILRIMCYFAAVVMFQVSSFLEMLSDCLKTTEKAEDSPEKTIEKRHDGYFISNHINKNEKPKQIYKVVDNIVNVMVTELLDEINKDHENQNQEYSIKVVMSDTENKLLNQEPTSQIPGESRENTNSKDIEDKVKEEITKNNVDHWENDNGNESRNPITKTENINKEINGELLKNYNGFENKEPITTTENMITKNNVDHWENDNGNESRNPITKTENINKEINGELLKNYNGYENKEPITTTENITITSEDIGSARVKKRHPIKNTAMLLITKTINENKLLDKRFKFETKFDKDKITKNNVDHWENDNGNESRNPITKTENINKEINGELLKNYNGFENKEPITTTENMITKSNDVWKDFDSYNNSIPNTKSENMMITSNYGECQDNFDGIVNRNSISTTDNMITLNNGECQDNYDGIENRKPISKTEYMTTTNSTEHWENNNSHEYKKLISKTEKKILNIFEVKDDIFGLPSTFSLAHCVCEDFHVSMGMTAEFKYKFGKIGALMDQHLRVSDVGHIIHNEQHVFYMVIKRKMAQRSLLSTLEIALYNLRNKMNDLKLTKLAIPKYGLDSFNMIDVKELISKIFTLSNIEVTICLTSSKLEIEHFNPPKVNYTFKQLWEMEKQTDIIMFINAKTVYSENWNDEVVERINAKYPFKEKLLKDINIKPMAHGDLLMYKVDTEVLFCVFIKPFDQYSAYFRCLEKAFQEMKSYLTGYRYLGVQQEPLICKPNQHTLTRSLAMLKSVFSNQNAEIWICGDTEQHKAHHYQQYKKIVFDAIEMNQKRNSKTNSRFKRSERKKHGNNSRHDLSEKHYSKNISDVNAVTYLNQEQISVDNYKTENWDN